MYAANLHALDDDDDSRAFNNPELSQHTVEDASEHSVSSDEGTRVDSDLEEGYDEQGEAEGAEGEGVEMAETASDVAAAGVNGSSNDDQDGNSSIHFPWNGVFTKLSTLSVIDNVSSYFTRALNDRSMPTYTQIDLLLKYCRYLYSQQQEDCLRVFFRSFRHVLEIYGDNMRIDDHEAEKCVDKYNELYSFLYESVQSEAVEQTGMRLVLPDV